MIRDLSRVIHKVRVGQVHSLPIRDVCLGSYTVHNSELKLPSSAGRYFVWSIEDVFIQKRRQKSSLLLGGQIYLNSLPR